MSHKAITWAIQQRGLKPSAKLVLWHLCDRYHPDHGCFPSQETLAADCEMSRSSLNNQLRALEKAGLIRREERRDETTNRQLSTRYRFPFEDGFEDGEAADPCAEIGHGAVSKNEAKPCPNLKPSGVANGCTRTCNRTRNRTRKGTRGEKTVWESQAAKRHRGGTAGASERGLP